MTDVEQQEARLVQRRLRPARVAVPSRVRPARRHLRVGRRRVEVHSVVAHGSGLALVGEGGLVARVADGGREQLAGDGDAEVEPVGVTSAVDARVGEAFDVVVVKVVPGTSVEGNAHGLQAERRVGVDTKGAERDLRAHGHLADAKSVASNANKRVHEVSERSIGGA